jgi:DNA processing protein
MNPGQPPTTSDEVRLVGYFDLDYPPHLQQIASAPAVLWVRGTAPAGNAAAVVGTRHPTKAGVDRVHKVVSVLVSAGYGIVSGLAAGVDTAAHEAALAEGGQTWAYLGSGVDYPTPRENVDLAERIVAAGGGLLAEVDPETKPSPRTLVARDRLQSGSSSLTVIGQSGIPSGTLHTARFTIEQERNLVVVAPPASEADDPAWAGNRALCDPDGCDPAILNAEGRLAERIAARKPTADHVLTSADALADLLG